MPWYFWAWIGMFLIDGLITVAKAGEIRGRYDTTFVVAQATTYGLLIWTFVSLYHA